MTFKHCSWRWSLYLKNGKRQYLYWWLVLVVISVITVITRVQYKIKSPERLKSPNLVRRFSQVIDAGWQTIQTIISLEPMKLCACMANELRHHAKFRQNFLNRGRDMVIFRFLCWNEKKRTGQDSKKVTKEKPPLKRCIHEKGCLVEMFSRWCFRRNHVCQVWKNSGVTILKESKAFSYWFLNGPYDSAALLRCLWSPERLKSPNFVRRFIQGQTIQTIMNVITSFKFWPPIISLEPMKLCADGYRGAIVHAWQIPPQTMSSGLCNVQNSTNLEFRE